MNNNVGIYNHNLESYQKIKKAFLNGERIVGIVHATGTGKTFNGIKLAYDNQDKKIIYVVPSIGIIEHIKTIISDNLNLDLEKDFNHVEFRTYQSFINLSQEEIANIKSDILILDEFHHIGAPVWGGRIYTMIETHPKMLVLGMSAYTVRDRGKINERDMVDNNKEELFSNKIVSRYDLCDAMIDGVIPKPIYKSAYTNLNDLAQKLEKKLETYDKDNKNRKDCMKVLNDVKKRIHEAPSISKILQKNIKPNGKYIYFCPPNSEKGANDIETIKKEAKKWFNEFIPEENIIFYTSTSEMGMLGKENRQAFYNDVNLDGIDVSNKLRVMFAINQYNEGIHAPNIDGIIMGRGTTSDIIYFEQLGRALSVRGNTSEMISKYEKYSKEELINICHQRDINLNSNLSKNDIIEILVAPIVIDLTNNLDFITELENKLKTRIEELKKHNLNSRRKLKISNPLFDIEVENQDLYLMLKYVMDRLTMSWMDKYNLAKAYYEHHGHLKIPINFKTINGYEEDRKGISLGVWLSNQIETYKGNRKGLMSKERIELLKKIGIDFETKEDKWLKYYELSKKYYEHFHNLLIPRNFKTINGYEENKEGYALGSWLNRQRQAILGLNNHHISSEKQKLLEEIGLVLLVRESNWQAKYNLAKSYYEHYGHLKIPQDFKTLNGYEEDSDGISLGTWINKLRQLYKENKLTKEQINLLNQIGMKFKLYDDQWLENYNLAKSYYKHYGNLNIPQKFKTINGYEPDENGVKLGSWLFYQRQVFKGNAHGKLSEEQIKLLEEIGMIFDIREHEWLKNYNLVKKYYEYHHNLLIPRNFKTINGYEENKNGLDIGAWLNTQKDAYKGQGRLNLTFKRIKLLEDLDINWFKEDKDLKLQKENITEENKIRKQKEILNRVSSLLNKYETLPNKNQVNNDMLEKLDSHKKR